MTIEVLTGGSLTTIQDLGRYGFASQGFGTSGACDKHAMRLANALIGNDLGWAVLECTLQGPTLRFDHATLVAVTGALPAVTLNGITVDAYRPLSIQAGDTLNIGLVSGGLRSYIAFLGGINNPVYMGSRSTDLRTHTGGWQGRALKTGDVLPMASNPRKFPKHLAKLTDQQRKLDSLNCQNWMAHTLGPFRYVGEQKVALLRTVPGPQEDRFTPSGLDTFTRSTYQVAVDSNRMACRLEGEKIESLSGFDIISDGIMEGSVQISASGLPLVMLADHQTTGGYAKIATVIGVDIPTIAQLRPGDTAAFCFVSPEEGLRASRAEQAMLQKIKELMAV